VQTGFLFVRRKDARPLDAIAGVRRIFSGRSLAGGMMSAGKLLVVAGVAFVAIRGQLEALVALQGRSAAEAVAAGIALVYAIALRVVVALLVLACVEYAYQRFLHERDLRMTRREIKEEARRQDGDPETKRRRRGIAAAWAASRLQRDIAGADVVVTSAGDGAAVALRFDPKSMSAPRVLAKGQGAAIAGKIREAAIRRGVPVIERPALATAIASLVGIARNVPAPFHDELAELFAYANAIRAQGVTET